MADGAVPMDEYGVPLSEALAQLRSELQEALESGEGERVRFAVDSITLELELVANNTRDANGKISLWKVLSAGGGFVRGNSATHRVTLTIKPRDQELAAGEETLIGDDM